MLVEANAIIHGFAILNKNAYGFFLVNRKNIADNTTNCCIKIPTVIAAMNIPSCEKISSTLATLAIDTAMRLITPIGVVLQVNERL